MKYPKCDYCNQPQSEEPWHGSGMFNGVESRHIHACDGCRHRLPTNAISLRDGDVVSADIHEPEKLDALVKAIKALPHLPNVVIIAADFDLKALPDEVMNQAGWYRKEQSE